MAGDRFTRLYQGMPGSASALIYNVPTNYSAIIKDVEIINIDPIGGNSDSITIWILPPTVTTPSDQYIWRPSTEIGPSEELTWQGSKSLEADCSIYVEVVSADVLTIMITGMEVDETPA